jgi:hypothetical protein
MMKTPMTTRSTDAFPGGTVRAWRPGMATPLAGEARESYLTPVKVADLPST